MFRVEISAGRSPGVLLPARFWGALVASALVTAFGWPAAATAQCNWLGGTGKITETCGNVGIGTTAPAQKLSIGAGHLLFDATFGLLSVNGAALKTGSAGMTWQVFPGSSTSNIFAMNNFSGASVFVVTATGAIGIGTTDPTEGGIVGSKLTIRQADNNTGLAVMNSLGARRFALNIDQGGGWTLFDGAGVNNGQNTWMAGISQSAGNVGIGTAPSANRLEVSGNANIQGTLTGTNIKAQYQDVAEWVPARRRLPPGTVVVIDPNGSNEVISAAQPYDTRVAGVVSAQPGLLLGLEGEGKAAVATTGRVKVKVDTTHGPLHVGDLLVTSDREGFAMKSEPVDVAGIKLHRPGTLLGKALEPLEQGKQAEILVLLSLQ